MKQLAILIFIMIIVFLPSCKFLREKGFLGRKADTMAIWHAKQDSIRVADSIKKVQGRLLALENARLDSIRKADQERMEWESKYKYNIIVGSFITPEYARKLLADYTRRGHNARILKLEGTKFEMVSAEAHDNFRNAVNRLKLYQDTVISDAWMYIKK